MPTLPAYERPSTRPDPARRFLLLSYNFPPGQATGALRWQKLVRHAAARGWEFDVVAAEPASPAEWDHSRLAELPEGTRVWCVPVSRRTGGGLGAALLRGLRRLRSAAPAPRTDAPAPPTRAAELVVETDVVFREETRWRPLSVRQQLRAYRATRFFQREWEWARAAGAVGRERLKERRYDAVISCGPPHMVHLAALRLARAAGIPSVVDMRDPWSLVPGLYSDVASPLWYRLAARFERACVRQAALVVTNTDAHRLALADVYPSRANAIVTALNGCDDDPLPPPEAKERFTVAYAGNVYIDRDPRPLFRAAAALVREHGLTPERFGLEFVGAVSTFGGQPLHALAEAEGIGAFLTLHERRPRAEALRLLSGASVLVSLPQGVDLAIPSKIYEYMQFDAWLLALARRGSATEMLLRDTGADVVDPDDTEGLAAVLRRRYSEFAAGARPAPLNADGRFGRARQAEILFSAMEDRLPPATAPAAEPAVSVREYFDRNVDEWDEERYRTPTYVGRGALALRWLRRRGAGATVLDIGCGAGHQTLGALRQGHRVVSMDFSYEMARATRDRVLRDGRRPMVVVADAMHPPFRDGEFDAVIGLGLVGFLPDRLGLLASIHRVLRPGGELIADAGVREERVLFTALDRRLTALAARAKRWLRPGSTAPRSPGRPSFYARAFRKHSPDEFERLLRDGGFTPTAAGGAGFGEIRILGRAVLPWRAEVWITRALNALSATRAGRVLAGRALIYVTRSVKPALPRPAAVDTLLFVANFGADTGYAWTTIQEVARRVATLHARGGGRTLMAFPGGGQGAREAVVEPIAFDYGATRSVAGTLRFVRLLRENAVRTLYLTDRPTWDVRYPLYRLAGVRRIVVHDRTSGARAIRGPVGSAAKRLLHRVPLLSADLFIAVSDYVARRLRESNGTPASRTVRIYNGVDLERFSRPGTDALHRSLGLQPETPIVFCSGRAQPYKGFQLVIDAAAGPAPAGAPEPAYVYCGDGPGFDELREHARRRGVEHRFHFLGRRDDVAGLLGSATVVVVPSLWEEAFGLTVVEGMLAGVPVIGSRRGGIPELIEDGVTGLLVEPGKAAELRAAIDRLLGDAALRAAIANRARAEARSRFGIDRAAEEIHRAIRSLAPAPVGGPAPVERLSLAE